MNKGLIRKWPWILSGIIIIVVIISALLADTLEHLDQIGGFISGIAGALAFIWLVAAYLLQSQELRLQRNELALQRASLDAQREEIKKMGKYAALEQISKMLEQFESSLANNTSNFPKSSFALPQAFIEDMKFWKDILESSDMNYANELHIKWMAIITPCKAFLDRVVLVVTLYEEATGESLLLHSGTPAEQIYFSKGVLRNIPFLNQYIGTAELLSTYLFKYEPGLDKIELAGFSAFESLFPGTVKLDALNELKEKVRKHDESYNKKIDN
jgi:hypothetical protein